MIILADSKKTLRMNAFYLYIMTAAKFLLPLLITVCLTRRLGKDNYGIISYQTWVMVYFIMLFDFGFNFSSTKRISCNRDNKEIVNSVIASVYTAKIILVGVGFVILLIMTAFIDLLKANLALTFLYYLSTAVQIFVPDFLYRGIEQMQAITKRYLIAKTISAAAIVLAVRGEKQILLVPVFYFVGTLAAAVYTNLHMTKKLGFKFSLSGIKDAIKELKESLVYFASTFTTTALSGTNTFIMGVVKMPEADIALWGVAFQVITAITSMYDPITTSLYPHVAAKKDYKTVLKVSAVLTPLVAVGCALVYFLADFVVLILAGKEYMEAATVLRCLVPLALFAFVAQMMGFPLLGAVGKQAQVTASTVISAVFHLIGMGVLIAAGVFTLYSLSALRVVSEFVLMAVRIGFVVAFVRGVNKKQTL